MLTATILLCLAAVTLVSGTDYCFSGICYKFRTERKEWGDAKQLCKDDGYTLAKIPSAGHQEFVFNKAKELRGSMGNNFWIGIDCYGGQWQWPDGTPAGFRKGYQCASGSCAPSFSNHYMMTIAPCGTRAYLKEGDWFKAAFLLEYPFICSKKQQ